MTDRLCVYCRQPLPKRQKKYCDKRCQTHFNLNTRVLNRSQQNIISALLDTGGQRWLPDSQEIWVLAKDPHTPLVEVGESKRVGVGKLRDYRVRLTAIGWNWAQGAGLLHEEEAV